MLQRVEGSLVGGKGAGRSIPSSFATMFLAQSRTRTWSCFSLGLQGLQGLQGGSVALNELRGTQEVSFVDAASSRQLRTWPLRAC